MGPKAPQGQTLIQAENRALRGDVESQDSQLFLERYHQKYAPGLRSSSPSEPLPLEVVQAQLQQYPRSAKVHQRFAGTTAFPSAPSKPVAKTTKPKTKAKSGGKAKAEAGAKEDPPGRHARNTPAKDKDQQHTAGTVRQAGGARTKPPPVASNSHNQRASPSQSSRHPSGQATFSEKAKDPELEAVIVSQVIGDDYARDDLHAPIGTVNPLHLTVTSTDDDHGGNNRNSGSVSFSSTTRRRPMAGSRRMEASQSPTQSNPGRSYDQYLPRGDDLVPTDSFEELQDGLERSEHGPDLLDDDRSLHEDDTGAVNFDNIDRYDTGFTAPDSIGTAKPTDGSPSQLIEYPETPAPNKNPFVGSKAHLLGSSQMFRQTQVSSACKFLSPTSSRPSPDNLQVQDLISPNGIISSPSKNFAEPSPLQGVTSSPQLLPPYDTSPQQAGHERAPSGEDATAVKLFQPMRRLHSGLVESYKPMHKVQNRRESSPQADLETDSDDDASYDDKERRRYRAMLKRMESEKQLRSINYERQSAAEDVIVPSTNTRDGKVRRTDSQEYLAQCEGKAGQDSQEAVEDSQDVRENPPRERLNSQQAVIDDSQVGALLSSEHAKNTSSNVGLVLDTLPNTARSPTMSPPIAEDGAPKPLDGSKVPRLEDADAIPDTSPARLRPLGEMLPHSSEELSKPESFSNLLGSSFQGSSLEGSGHRHGSLVDTQSSASTQTRRAARHSQRKFAKSQDATAGQDEREDNLPNSPAHLEVVEILETSSVVSSSPPAPPVSPKLGLRDEHTSPESPCGSSSLSVLTSTPTISNNTTPLTQETPARNINLIRSSRPSIGEPQTSPAAAKASRRGNSSAAPKPQPAVAPSRSLRASIRRSSRSFARHASVSTDELARTPTSSAPRPAFEQSAMLSGLGRTSLRMSPASRDTSRGGGPKIFTGMAFAISFRSKQPGEKDSDFNSRLGLSFKVSDRIKEAGGKILTSGFDQLFEFAAIKKADVASSTPPPDEEIRLIAAARNTGFTALIADGHSRKVKYMQALALGLPCIHQRWITTCAEKQKLVDWSDYLLCAGNSSLLGNAIRSRNLTPYDAASAKLSEVIENRPQLLHGSRILLVLRKQDESIKMAYVFLARVLGASLSRVYSMDEARRQLRASEDAGYPYNWVYVEDKAAVETDLFSDGTSSTTPSSTALATGSKKRKRKSEVDLADPPPKKIRALSDELVIQSLILGRLLEEGEMGG